MLRSLSAKKRRAFYEGQLNTKHEDLFEGENKSVYIHGFTEDYVKVKTFWNPDLVNTKHKIIVDEIDQDGLVKIDFIKELKAILR